MASKSPPPTNPVPPPEDPFIVEPPGPPHGARYEKIRLLGNGTFSQVFECVEVGKDRRVAIKVVSKSFLFKNGLHEQFTKEVRIHFELDHPNVLRLFRVFESKSHMYLVLELGANGTLGELLDRRKTLTEPEIRHFLRGMLEGLRYIHLKNILHRDLKPANLILGDNLDVKIADFGLAAYVPKTKRRRKTFCGTPYFIAPEIITREGHSFEVDFWSLGVILYSMAHGSCPFQSDSPEEVYKLVLAGDFTIDPHLSPALHQLLRRLLHKNVAERADYQSIIDSPFFQTPNPLKSLPLSALETRPSDSFLTSPDSTARPAQSGPCGRVQRNVYTKSASKSLSGLEDVLPDLPEYEYLKKWVNFSDKFGVGGIFSNGIICICFNDKSKIVLSNFGISFHYLPNNLPPDAAPPTFNVLQYPKELEKKVRLLDYFIKFLRQNAHLVRVTESMPDNFVHITDFRLTKYAALFVLSNKVRQAIFQDGTEVHVFRDSSKRKRVLFIDQQRHRQLLEAGLEPEEGIKRRLQHVNETLKQVEGTRNQNS